MSFQIYMGLRPEHHELLNNMFTWDKDDAESHEITYGQLRKSYEGDSIAQQQIDGYDPTTEYQAKMEELTNALKANNEQEIEALHNWFNSHYPDLG